MDFQDQFYRYKCLLFFTYHIQITKSKISSFWKKKKATAKSVVDNGDQSVHAVLHVHVYKLVERVTFAKQKFSQSFEQRQHYKNCMLI